jgi:hypothetical protein
MKLIHVTLSSSNVDECGYLREMVFERLSKTYGYYCRIKIDVGESMEVKTDILDLIEDIQYLIDDCIMRHWLMKLEIE